MMNPAALMKLKGAVDTFNRTHPRVKPFFEAVAARGIKEGTIIEMTIKTPEGETMTSNIKVQPSDLEALQLLRELQ